MRQKNKKSTVDKEIRRKTKLTSRTPFNVREAYKIARTNIMFSLTESGCRKVAVSSSFPGEGKTTTCTNLALSFAEMGKKVLIIDCDMRKPQVHTVFALDNQVGISNVLGGFANLLEAIHILKEDNLSVITAGHIPPNPAELLASDKMTRVLKELEKAYDYIFIDTPPVNVVTDAAVISQYVQGMLLVVRQEQSTYKDVEMALNKLELAKAKVLGFILTGEKCKGGSYGKYGKYGKYGSYKNYASYE